MDVITLVHVAGGVVGLITGAVALGVQKGAALHVRVGWVFVVAMLIMAIPGGVVSLLADKPFDALSSLMTFYLIISGWSTFKDHAGRYRLLMMGVAALCIVGYLGLELRTLLFDIRGTDAPVGAGYVFATVLSLALWGDFRIWRQPSVLVGKQRVIRHMWRMNFGLFIATGSFFGARPHLFPEWMQVYGLLLLLTVAPLLVMAFWRFRLRAPA